MPTSGRKPQYLADGRYALTARLGEGGMAGVYRAWDSRLKVDRAIKIMLPRAARSKKLRKRFEREAQTLARLEHAHLVRIYDVASQAGVPFLVMELITGGTLNDWVERNGAMPPRQATGAVLQLCEGVMAAHAAGVVHRDIKPHNVLVSQSGVCKLADFGIAHVDDEGLTRTGSAMGTMGYMPPEQRTDAKSVDARCDQFSVAATLWFLLTNGPVVDLFLFDEKEKLRAGIPEPLHAPLRTALAYEREDRYPDVGAFRDALAEALQALPADPPCPELAAPEPTMPEIEGDWFEELAPLFDDDFKATPEPADLRPPKALPYYMPRSSPTGRPPPHRTEPAAEGRPPTARPSDSLPDYIDREALSQTGRDPLPAPMPDPTEPEEPTSSMTAPMMVGGGAIAGAVALAVAGVVFVAFLYTAVGLERTSSAVDQHETDYYSLLDEESGLINDLVGLGAPRESLDGPYFAYQDAETPEAKAQAADALVDALQQAAAGLGDAKGARADTVRAQVQRIARERDDLRASEADHEAFATTLRGRLLTLLGVGD